MPYEETDHVGSSLWVEVKQEIDFASFLLRERERPTFHAGSALRTRSRALDRVWHVRASSHTVLRALELIRFSVLRFSSASQHPRSGHVHRSAR